MNLQVDLKSNFNTDGRTDERYEDETYDRLNLAAVDAGARTGDPMAIGELVDPRLWLRTGERHEVARHGEREPIAPHVRSAVYFRDRLRCELCAWREVEGEWHLDHITPWSAGGADTTDNLRVLCAEHNQKRSNRIDVLERSRRPATWWCVNCYDHGNVWEYVDGMPLCPIHGSRGCRVVGGYSRWAEAHGELPTWHQRGAMTSATTLAYCAHCDAPGLTDVAL